MRTLYYQVLTSTIGDFTNVDIKGNFTGSLSEALFEPLTGIYSISRDF